MTIENIFSILNSVFPLYIQYFEKIIVICLRYFVLVAYFIFLILQHSLILFSIINLLLLQLDSFHYLFFGSIYEDSKSIAEMNEGLCLVFEGWLVFIQADH